MSTSTERRSKRTLSRAMKFASTGQFQSAVPLLAMVSENYPTAAFIVGICYFHGIGVMPEMTEAGHWFRQAALAGHTSAQTYLAVLHLAGFQSERLNNRKLFVTDQPRTDISSALHWATTAALTGEPAAISLLAFIYKHSPSPWQDEAESIRLYEKASALGWPQAKFMLGITRLREAQSDVQAYAAIELIKQAAGSGFAYAHDALGVIYENDAPATQDFAQSIFHYRVAAHAGVRRAMARLGFALLVGRGESKDLLQGETWLRKAALAGDIDSALSLGQLYAEGGDVPANYVEAAKWFRKAAEGGSLKAAQKIGLLYLTGSGLPRDYQEATFWFCRGFESASSDQMQHSNLDRQKIIDDEYKKYKLEDSAKNYLYAINLSPNSHELFNNLGVVFHELKRDLDAIRCYEQALLLKPDYSIAFNNYGVALAALNRHKEAIDKYRKSIIINHDYPEALNNLGVSLHYLEYDEEASEVFQKAIHLRPEYFDSVINLAHTMRKLKRWGEAAQGYQKALLIRPNNEFIHLLLAEMLGRAQLSFDSIKVYRDIISRYPKNPDGYAGLAFMLQEVGLIDDARANFERAISIDCKNLNYYRGWALNGTVSINDPLLPKIFAQSTDLSAFDTNQKIQLHFALGKILADIGFQKEAFNNLISGNELRRQQVTYDVDKDVRTIEQISKIFTIEFIKTQEFRGLETKTPIFIVGMPRSGSTLIEQILGSHRNIVAGGELRALSHSIAKVGQVSSRSLFPKLALTWQPDQLREIGMLYLHNLRNCIPTDKDETSIFSVTDKRLDNFYFVGLIKIIFPNAKIIHASRDPIDTCLSCFSLLFEEAEFTYNLGELGRRYRACENLLQHWKTIFQADEILTIKYEDVVANVETEAKRLIDYCGLEWDPNCLEFYRTNRPVRTASVVQVRKPIYKSSVKKWHLDPEIIRPLLDALSN